MACEEESGFLWNSEWDKYEDPEDDGPDNPSEPGDDSQTPSEPGIPSNAKARFVWIDAAANFKDYANDKAKIESDMAKIKATMCNCGALTIPELQEKAKLTVVSSTSIVEGGAHDVILKDKGTGATI